MAHVSALKLNSIRRRMHRFLIRFNLLIWLTFRFLESRQREINTLAGLQRATFAALLHAAHGSYIIVACQLDLTQVYDDDNVTHFATRQ